MKRNVVIALLFPVPLLVVGGVVGGVIYFNNRHGSASSVLSASTSSGSMPELNGSGAESIPLTPATPQNNTSDPSQLQVDTTPESSHKTSNPVSPGQNGSPGNTSPTSGAPSTKSAPGPDSFSTYDQYKTSQHTLYADIRTGTGSEVANGTKVAVSYKGWLTNGTLFDETKTDGKGQPQAFVLTIGEHKVIPGWEEGLLGMKAGGIRRLVVPPSQGYGDTGQGPIPGGAVLVFDIQLLQAL